MPYKDPEVRRAKANGYTKAWYEKRPEALAAKKKRWRLKNRVRLNAMARERWPKHYAQTRERRLADLQNRPVKKAGRPRTEFCEVCGDPPRNGKSLAYDHCHQSGQFRGWLCNNCNFALGLVHDDTQRLRKLIAYLERSHKTASPQLVLAGI
jgi:hypothetical protein